MKKLVLFVREWLKEKNGSGSPKQTENPTDASNCFKGDVVPYTQPKGEVLDE